MAAGGAEPPASDPSNTPDEVVAQDPTPAPSLPPDSKHHEIEGRRQKQTITLREFYGRWILWIMAIQLVIVNHVFFWFLVAHRFNVTDRLMEVWLVGTFVQVVGIVVGITRSLFPTKGDGG